MKIYICVPTVHLVSGGVKKLLQYYDHLKDEFDVCLVNYHNYFGVPASIDKRYPQAGGFIEEEQFYASVKKEDCVLFAPATIYQRLKQRSELAGVRKINIEMGFAARNCDYLDSADISEEIEEVICFGQIESDDIYRTCGKRYPVIPIGVDLDKFKEDPPSRINNLIGVYVDERHKIPNSPGNRPPSVGSFEIASQLMNHWLPEYKFKIIRRPVNPCNWYSEQDMIKHYQSCDIFVSLNRNEGPFLVVLEAMACGCAVVCVDAKGTDDLVVPWRSGLRVQPCEPSFVRNAVKRLLDKPGLKEKIRQGALSMAQRHSLVQEKEKIISYIKTGKV